MKYKTPAALEMAVKAAAKAAPFDTSKAIAGFYFDRLLCRIFSESEPSFVLKGGQSMLARTISARATRDIDLLSHAGSPDEALAELKRLAAVDLDDFLTYSFAHVEVKKAKDDYREGLKVFFIPYLGATAKQEVSIDLVIDQIVCENPEKMVPKGRLDVGDLKVFDYLLYPVASAMADKICATMQLFEGHESSRIKDLIDLTIFLTSQSFGAEALRKQVELEVALRKMEPIENYKAPQTWFTLDKGRFSNLAKETGLPREYHDIEVSYVLVSKCIDEVLSGKVDGSIWDPQHLIWI